MKINDYIFIFCIFLSILISVFICLIFMLSMKKTSKNNYNRKLKKYYKIRIKNIKKQFKDYKLLNFEVSKFEYNLVYNIIKEEANKLKVNNDIINEIYIILVNIYHKELKKEISFEFNSVEFLSCVFRALFDESVLLDCDDIKNINNCDLNIIDIKNSYINKLLRENVIKALKNYYKDIYYHGIHVNKENEKLLLLKYALEKSSISLSYANKVISIILDNS